MYRNRRLLRSFLVLGLLAGLPVVSHAATSGESKRVVNINTADATKLALLPRVGPSVAERILEYRKENGPFKAPEDLMHVHGIGEKTFALIKPYIALSGETSLTEKVRGSGDSASRGSRTKSKSKASGAHP
jgi:competence protein ComEA